MKEILIKTGIVRMSALFMYVCSLAMPAYGQDKALTLTFGSESDTQGCSLYVKPLNVGQKTEVVPMSQAGAAFSATVPASAEGLYSVTCVRDNAQYFATISAHGEAAQNIPVSWQHNCIVATDTDDNRAIGAYAVSEAQGLRAMWDGTQTAESLRDIIKGCQHKADSVLGIYRCSDGVAQYIRIRAYTSAGNAYQSLPVILRCKPAEVPFSIDQVLPQPQTVLDTRLATLFASASGTIAAFMPRGGSLTERLAWLHANFSTKEIVDKITETTMDNFVARFDYAGHYDEGLATVTEVTERYGLDMKYVNRFKFNRSTIKGSPFPAGLTFTDRDGKRHTIDEFRGKYVYP